MLAVFGWLAFVGWSYDWNLDYYECIEGSPYYSSGLKCKNPFYEPPSWKNEPELPPGVYGANLGPLFRSVYYAPFILLGLAFYINYIVHNKNIKTIKRGRP